MARIPEEEIERIKRDVSLERLVEASGVELKKMGKDLFGVLSACPPGEFESMAIDFFPVCLLALPSIVPLSFFYLADRYSRFRPVISASWRPPGERFPDSV